MSETIIVALITGLCAVIGQWIISRNQAAKQKIDDAVRDKGIEDRLSALEHKIDIHNGYAERFAEIGSDIAVIKNDIKTLYKTKSE